MTHRFLSVLLAGSTALAAAGAIAAEGDPARGARLFETCRGCHAVKGYFNVYPSYRVPKLGGQKSDYTMAALAAYQQGSRGHDTMHANAATLSGQDIVDIAVYLEQYGD